MILYRGPSMIDGSPIVAIAAKIDGRSDNTKTGGMVQTYIIRDDANPVEAARDGRDVAICGTCPFRANPETGKERGCYVTLIHGPSVVYRTFARGGYRSAETPEALAAIGRGRKVRLGTYGDPAAVPFQVWAALVSEAAGHTGYTHQWRSCDPAFADLLMASVETPEEREQANAAGWRTYRVRTLDAPVLRGEIVCPASAEKGHKAKCEDCLGCGGHASKTKRDFVIAAHGSSAVVGHAARKVRSKMAA